MDVAVKLSDEETLARLVAMALANEVKPLLDKAVEEAMPGKSLTQGQLAAKLHMSVGTDQFEKIAYQSGMPRFLAGSGNPGLKSAWRWYEPAVDKFLLTYTEA